MGYRATTYKIYKDANGREIKRVAIKSGTYPARAARVLKRKSPPPRQYSRLSPRLPRRQRLPLPPRRRPPGTQRGPQRGGRRRLIPASWEEAGDEA